MDLQSVKQRFGIIGNAPGLNYALSVAIRVAPTDLTVLITGESGVGKEIFSNIIHQLSPRKHNPFIAVNCGAIPEGTIDSELFGHEKGAFTGAHEARQGYFEYVKGGTIFLDEIGEMPLGTQARLLRVLETGEFIRVGSSKVQKTDVRVVAATNVDLTALIKKGKFREDLYYRLNTVPIYVPPLRERKEDIPLLFRKFCVDFAEKQRTTAIQLDDEAVELLKRYHWPGNVRELKNIAEQVSILASSRIVTAEELAKFLPQHQPSLPAIVEPQHEESSMSEREILYKLIFEMREDLNILKKFVLEMAQGNLNPESYRQLGFFGTGRLGSGSSGTGYSIVSNTSINGDHPAEPIVLQPSGNEEEVEEESLSLEEMEKRLIKKALKKHRGKRKYAAADLGISERTLYRKIKEYNIQE